jgi:hypothetical protein
MAIAQSPELVRSFGGSELDWLTREQYYDFVTGQSFRQSVLCRDQMPFSRTPSARALMSLRITVNVRPGTHGRAPRSGCAHIGFGARYGIRLNRPNQGGDP